MLGVPDEFFTVDEVAQRLALPSEMIRRRIESGDIPVHWVEVDGKLEMRVAAEDVGGLSGAPAFSDPFAPPQTEGDLQPAAGEPAAEEWAVTESEYSQGMWTPVEETNATEANPWEVNPTSDLAAAEVGLSGVPVWRPDPTTWEDEPLDSVSPTPAEPEFPPISTGYQAEPAELADEEEENIVDVPQPEAVEDTEFAGAFFSPEPSEVAFATPPAPGFGFQAPPASPAYGAEPTPSATQYGFEPAAAAPPFGFDGTTPAYPGAEEESEVQAVEYEEVEESQPALASVEYEEVEESQPALASVEYEEVEESQPALASVEYEEVEESQPALASVEDDAAPPSALVTSQIAGAGSVAINSIDARELVAGLFERWERALEQRIQAEQRLRFEAELEQRLRQVRDLRQELDQTRKTQAAQMAEREREMMELRNKVREMEQAPKKSGFFRR
ncbi:MAG: hypothetical protein ACYCTZ_03195 [Candidatus Dormibacteria bacterium]